MTKNRKQSDEPKKQDCGVLYIRYDKASVCGHLIENLKRSNGYGLNKQILNLIFLSEIVELLNIEIEGVDLETLNHAFYQSQRLFSDKLNRAEFHINNLTLQINRQKNIETNVSSASRNAGTLFPTNRLIDLAFKS